MSQMKWVFIMVMIVIVALGVLVALLLYDEGVIPAALPALATTATPAGAPPEVTQNPGQMQVDAPPAGATYTFSIYDDGPVHYGDIAYMGSDNNGDDGAMAINPGGTDDPYSGDNCIRITYNPPSSSHWAGMMWLSGANNFPPNLPVDGVDAAQANQLRFYARGQGSTKFFIENDQKKQVTQSVRLTQDWTLYTLAVPADWEQICVGFGFASSGAAGESTIYLDDIVYSN